MREKQTPHSAFQYPYIFLSPHTKSNNNHTQEMSMNHFSAELPEAHWWSHYTLDQKNSSPYHKSLTASHNSAVAPADLYRSAPMFSAAPFDLNNDDDDELSDEHELIEQQEIQKERLFEKPLTPSDVGKLNRLVIPKQQAEKHFPLNGSGESGENGFLLGFEDELGKSWRFRYSYWNSSQSYVLTKGWSRFVKEKRLDAGDIVVFARDRVDTGRFFIGWRRRNSISGGQDGGTAASLASSSGCSASGAGGWGRILYSAHQYPVQPPSNSVHFQSQSIHAGATAGSPKQTTSSVGSGNPKTLRLFGVNLECQADESEPWTPVGSPMSSHHHQSYHPYQYYSNNHMDINFSGADVYRQG